MIEFRVLGPFEVGEQDRLLALGSARQRALLALLLLHRGETVSADRLVDALWGERAPPTAVKIVQGYVSNLRKALGDGLLVTREHGYLLQLEQGQLDADRFESLVAEGRLALGEGDAGTAAERLREALDMWRGPALADFAYERFAHGEIDRLEEIRLAALEDRIDADLAQGRHTELVAELGQLVREHPLRERLQGQLMLALYRSGRQADALGRYQQARRKLIDELGIEPGPALKELERAILDQDPALDLPRTSRAAPALPARRGGLLIAAGGAVLLAVIVSVAVILANSGSTALRLAGDSVGAISAAGGAISAEAQVGSSPSGVAIGQGSVWVTNYNDGTVSRIDLKTHTVETIPVESTPTGIAVGANAVWVANSYSGTVSRIDPADDSVQSILVGNGPSGVAVGDGAVWVANRNDGTLSRIDLLSDTAQTIRLGGATEATDVAVGKGAVWVSDAASGRVLRVDPRTNRVVNIINVGNGPSAITAGFGSVWVTNNLDGTISRINAQTSRVTATEQVGSGPNAIAAGAGAVWVANELGGTVVRIDAATNAQARPIAVGNSPRGLAVEGGVVWVAADASVTRVPTSGPGLTQPTSPSGSKISGGVVHFIDGAPPTPNYIFPMYGLDVCSTANANQLMDILYRPLYWYGNNYRPTVDYGYSIGRPPEFSDRSETVTVKLNPGWKWSDGEAVTSRDLVFWMNVLKVNPATEWCGYAPGYFPDNVTSYSAPDPQTFVLRFNRAYDPEWVLYNELSQLTPLPLAWDRTALGHPAPRTDNGHLPDTTKAGAAAVYRFLDRQSEKLGTWASSPLWRVVDGPFKLQGFTSTGEVTLVPNPSYSGSPKPTISKLVELPYSSDAASYDALRSGGPSAVTVANLPSQYAPAIPRLTTEGYELNPAVSYAFNYFPLNFNSSASTSPGGEPVRYIFRQAYFRRALQHLVDQQGWITAFSNGTRSPTCGPIPLSPPSPLVNPAAISTAPCAFSVTAAEQLLSANGWNVVRYGTTMCVRPGTGAGECGTGIKAGEGISFNVDYISGVPSLQDEMKDLAAQARRVGIDLSLTTHPFDAVFREFTPCQPSQNTCTWTAVYPIPWVYGPAYLPTGESLYTPGSAVNAESYADPKMTQLITATITSPASGEARALTAYGQYVKQQLPVLFAPSSIRTYGPGAGTLVARKLGGYAANALGLMNPEDWYFTK